MELGGGLKPLPLFFLPRLNYKNREIYIMAALKLSRMNEASFWRNVWTVNPEVNTTIDEMKTEGYWAHTASRMKPWDLIEARAEDGSFYAMFIVLDTGRTWAKVHLLNEWKLENVEQPEVQVDKEYFIKFRGPQFRWSVIRTKDKAVVKENLFPKEEAIRWVNEHVKALNA